MNLFGGRETRTATERDPLDESSDTEYPTSWEQYQRDDREWPYDVIPKNPDEHEDAIQLIGLHEFAFEAEDGELYAGCYPRAMINNAAYGEQPLMLGTDTYNQPVGILHKERYRHMFAGGQTGTGKSTFGVNGCIQDAFEGNGFCFLDPGGDDSLDLIRLLPEYRLDDLIYMDVGSEYREYSVGLNYLDTLHEPGQPGYKRECEAIAKNLLPMLEADEYARMEGVASNVLRYLIKADYEDEDYNYTLIDLYYLLGTEEARQAYADQVNQDKLEFLKPYASKIADLPDKELEPLIRRLQTWVESDIVRPFIAQRDSDFSIAEAIANNRILVVRCNIDKKTRQMVTAAITTKIWSAVSARPSPTDRQMMELEGVETPDIGFQSQTSRENVDYDPFFLVADEFHAVVSEETNVGEMLAMARKKGLGLFILTQQLNQLPQEQRQHILGNCSTLVAFDPGHDTTEKQVLAEAFPDVDQEDLGLGRYSFWTTITDKNGDVSPPFVTDASPPYPPLRSVKKANAAINRSQHHFGSQRLTDKEILQQVPDAFSHMIASIAGGEGVDAEAGPTSDPHIAAIYEAAYRTQLHHDALGEAVPYEAVVNEWRSMTEEPLSDNKLANLFEQIPSGDLVRGKHKGEKVVRLTTEGIERAGLTQNTGSAENGGGFDHRLVLTKARAAYTVLGYDTWLPTQDSTEAADGMADLPIDPFETRDPVPHEQLVEDLREEYPAVYEHSETRHVAIEAETSTMEAPQQTLTNLRKAINTGRLCVFALKDETFNDDRDNQFDYWRERGEKIIYDTYRDGNQVKITYDQLICARKIDEDGNRTFYNHKKRRLMIEEGVYALRPNREERSQIRWQEDGEEIVLYDLSETDENGEPAEYARFDGPKAVANPTRSSVTAYSEYDEDKGVHVVRTADGGYEEYATKEELAANWQRIYLPFIPENEFNRMPTEDDFVFVVFPESANTDYDQPQLAARGETQPLLPSDATMPDVTTVVAPDDDDEDDENDKSEDAAPSVDAAEDSERSSAESDPTGGYDPDEVIETIVTGSELTDDDVAPVVAQVSDRIDGLTHDQAVATITMLLDVELGDEGANDESSSEAETDPDDSPSEAAATSDTDSAESTDDQSTEDDATESDERQVSPDTTEHPPTETDTTVESPETSPTDASASNTPTDESSPSEMDLEPTIVPIEEPIKDESVSEEAVANETVTAIPPITPSDEERQTETSTVDHPLIDPVAFTIADQTDVSRQHAREVTIQCLPKFETPTYPPVVHAVAKILDVEIQLESVPQKESDTGTGESETGDETTNTDFWGSRSVK
ncbi:TraM recognition domain-containing protein [Halocatena marina]|uniref:TraM recognition domain-containing protein n=1 Tax=Halocatena marina TaxID=2934937 RepID=A0ABD5YXZ5_9EURY